MSDRIPFNVNDYVWVKLTKVGTDEMIRQHFELQRVIRERGGRPDIGPYWMPRGDDNGWHRFQLWDLMKRLGHLCIMGCPQPFETGIEFERPRDNG